MSDHYWYSRQLMTRGLLGKCHVLAQSVTMEKRYATSQTDTYNRCEWWTPDELIISLTNRWSERVYGDSLTWRVHVAYWLTDGLKDQLAIHTLIDRRPDRCIHWLISWLIMWMYHLIDRPTDTSRQWVPNEYKLVTDWTSETVTWWTTGLLYV